MTDFLDGLEQELIAAAQRRATAGPQRTAILQDVRAVGRGALLTASVAAVAAVVAMAGVLGRHRVASPPPPRGQAALAVAHPARDHEPCGSGAKGASPVVGGAAPDRALVNWLSDDGSPGPADRTAALQRLDPSAFAAEVVYPRFIRSVSLPGLGRVLLIPVRGCGARAGALGSTSSGPRSTLLAEVRTRAGTATVDLGTTSAIRSGAAFRAVPWLLVRTASGMRHISGVPAGVVRVVCAVAGAPRSFTVIGHLVTLPVAAHDCDLTYRPGAGSSTSSA